IIENAAAAQNKDIKPLDFACRFLPSHTPNGNSALDLMPAESILRIKRKDGDLDRQRSAQLEQNAFQDRLVAEVHATIGSRNSNPEHSALIAHFCHTSRSSGQSGVSDGQERGIPCFRSKD